MHMHTSTQNNDVSLAKEFQQHLSIENRKNCVIDKGKFIKRASERKRTDRKYHVQDNVDVAHKYVKIYFSTKKLVELPFCGPYSKPHGARGLSKHYNLRFDPKLGHGVPEIIRIPCACV